MFCNDTAHYFVDFTTRTGSTDLQFQQRQGRAILNMSKKDNVLCMTSTVIETYLLPLPRQLATPIAGLRFIENRDVL